MRSYRYLGVWVKIFRVWRYAFLFYLKVTSKQGGPEVSIIHFWVFNMASFIKISHWLSGDSNKVPVHLSSGETVLKQETVAKYYFLDWSSSG